MESYSDYLLQHMQRDDLEVESRFYSAKQVLSKAYSYLEQKEQQAYDKAYGQLIGHDQAIYGYEKIDGLTGEADSQQNGEGAELALDGNTDTFWHSNYNGHVINDKKNNYTITLRIQLFPIA